MIEKFLNCPTVLDFNIIEIKNSFLLIHRNLPKFVFTNSVGVDVLKSYERTRNLDSVSKFLQEKYKISFEQANKDAKLFIDQMIATGISLDEDYNSKIPSGIKPEIKRLIINLVSGCNLNCLHCGVPYEPGKIVFWDKKILEKIIAGFLDSNDKSMVFTGGEPMLHPDWLEIIRLSQSYGRTILASNCTLLKKKDIQQLSKMNVILQVSLESHIQSINDKIRGKGNFEKVKKILNLLVEHGMGDKIAICTTLAKHNSDQIIEMIEFTKSLGITSFRLLPLQKISSAVKNWDSLQPSQSQLDFAYSSFYKALAKSTNEINLQGGIPGLYLNFAGKSMWCQIGSIINIDEKKNVYPCSLLMHENFNLGNIGHDSVEKIENSEKFKNLVLDCYNRKKLITQCSTCAISSICQGGCPGTVWHEHGDIFKPDDLCSLRAKHFISLLSNFNPSKSS
ncbi:radical SAM protein [bacterium]|nr:radical SAM protein [bacterium]